MEIQHRCKALLSLISEVRRQQARRRAETAAGFDFFTAISRLRDENRHSRFIASLLNPRGRHGQGLFRGRARNIANPSERQEIIVDVVEAVVGLTLQTEVAVREESA